MTFTAKLKRTSTIWTTWRSANRLGGEVGGVMFTLAANNDYVSAILTGDQVEALKYQNAIILEVATGIDPVLADSLNAVFAPEPEPDVREDAKVDTRTQTPQPPPPPPPPPRQTYTPNRSSPFQTRNGRR